MSYTFMLSYMQFNIFQELGNGEGAGIARVGESLRSRARKLLMYNVADFRAELLLVALLPRLD